MSKSVIIADEMGLGKSPQAIAMHQLMKQTNQKQRTLVLAPAQLIPNWRRQIEKFTGITNINRLFSTDPTEMEIMSLLASDAQCEWNIINYDLIGRKQYILKNGRKEEIPNQWFKWLSMANFDLIIVDEAHYGKNPEAERTRSMLNIKCDRWIFLTGTPVLNRPGELWPMLNIYKPETFASYDRFLRQYTINGKMARNVNELREILKPVMIRRLKKDVIEDLPPINRIYEYHEMSAKARQVYNKVLMGIYEDMERGTVMGVTSILAQLTRLKQVCTIDKHDRVARRAMDKYDSSEGEKHRKILIFTQWVNSAYAIANRLMPEALVITGELSIAERMQMVDEFQSRDDIHYLVCSTKAASEGLDITAAGTVIFADLMWTPAAHEQAEGRAYGRQSDSHSIDSEYIITENSIEEWILELLALKQDVINETVEGVEASRDVSVAGELVKKLRENMFQIKKQIKEGNQ